MVSLQGCRIFAFVSIILLSGCLGGRSTDIYNSYSAASMGSDTERLLKSTEFFKERGCKFVSCSNAVAAGADTFTMKCTMKTPPGTSMKTYDVNVKVVGDKINEISYNGTLIT